MLQIQQLFYTFAASDYSCGKYGADSYGACTSATSDSGLLSDTGTRILLIATIAAVVLFVSLLARHIVKRRSVA